MREPRAQFKVDFRRHRPRRQPLDRERTQILGTGIRPQVARGQQALQLVLAAQVLVGPAAGPEGGYPRSATMRLLTQRPELVARALGMVFRLFRSRSR